MSNQSTTNTSVLPWEVITIMSISLPLPKVKLKYRSGANFYRSDHFREVYFFHRDFYCCSMGFSKLVDLKGRSKKWYFRPPSVHLGLSFWLFCLPKFTMLSRTPPPLSRPFLSLFFGSAQNPSTAILCWMVANTMTYLQPPMTILSYPQEGIC